MTALTGYVIFYFYFFFYADSVLNCISLCVCLRAEFLNDLVFPPVHMSVSLSVLPWELTYLYGRTTLDNFTLFYRQFKRSIQSKIQEDKFKRTSCYKLLFIISLIDFSKGAIHNPRHIKPQTRQTPDTSNLRHIKPQTHQASDKEYRAANYTTDKNTFSYFN